jgi:putative endonuclease
MSRHKKLGEKGEQLATDWFSQKGYRILHRNWRFSHYEIDLIAEKEDRIHFIEVKTRSNNVFGFPEESVTPKKIRRLMCAAEEYLLRNCVEKPVQYDILSIGLYGNAPPEFYLIEDVFL